MLNMDFSKKITIDTNSMPWQASPAKGVWRKPLAREEAERGHATSIVKYDPGSRFAEHEHPKGEEILVLKGIFSDENGDYGPGTYLRNPSGSKHAPFSHEGCELLVKLHQIHPGDTRQIAIDIQTAAWAPGIGNLSVLPLHDFEGEHVALVKWPAGEVFQEHRHAGGEEIFVISGILADEHGTYKAGTWLRSPHMSKHKPYAIEETIIWVKVGHLPA